MTETLIDTASRGMRTCHRRADLAGRATAAEIVAGRLGRVTALLAWESFDYTWRARECVLVMKELNNAADRAEVDYRWRARECALVMKELARDRAAVES